MLLELDGLTYKLLNNFNALVMETSIYIRYIYLFRYVYLFMNISNAPGLIFQYLFIMYEKKKKDMEFKFIILL